MKKIFVLMIKAYQYFIRPLLGQNCRFYPSCSEYANEALLRYGCVYGALLSVQRLLKCHPWHKGGFDPIPKESVKGSGFYL